MPDPSIAERIALDLIRRSAQADRALTRFVLLLALSLSFMAVYFAVHDTEMGGIWFGKMLGLTGALTFASTFLSTALIGLFLRRHYLRYKLRAWVREAVRSHGLQPEALEHVIAMFRTPSLEHREGAK